MEIPQRCFTNSDFQYYYFLLEWSGDLAAGGDVSFHSFFYHLLVLLMQLELASISFLLSAISSKKQIGLAMGLVLIFYSIDMIVRIISKVNFLKFITPYYYADSCRCFSHTTFDTFFLVKACAVYHCFFASVGSCIR